MHNMKEILILIPAYNEEKNLPGVLQQLTDLPFFPELDILVINDCSSDRTAEVARAWGCKVISHVMNMGYGMALQTGYKFAVENGYRYLIQMDGDGQHMISNVEYLYARIRKGNLPDLLLGSRFMPDSGPYHMSKVRRDTIRFFSAIIKWITKKKITDPTSGLQLLNQSLFTYYSKYQNFDPQYPDANMIIRILLYGFEVEEFPAQMQNRFSGESMHSGLKPVMYMLQMSISMLIITARVHHRQRRGK